MEYYSLRHKPTGKLLRVETETQGYMDRFDSMGNEVNSVFTVGGDSDPLYLVKDIQDVRNALFSKFNCWSEYRIPKLRGIDPAKLEIVTVKVEIVPDKVEIEDKESEKI